MQSVICISFFKFEVEIEEAKNKTGKGKKNKNNRQASNNNRNNPSSTSTARPSTTQPASSTTNTPGTPSNYQIPRLNYNNTPITHWFGGSAAQSSTSQQLQRNQAGPSRPQAPPPAPSRGNTQPATSRTNTQPAPSRASTQAASHRSSSVSSQQQMTSQYNAPRYSQAAGRQTPNSTQNTSRAAQQARGPVTLRPPNRSQQNRARAPATQSRAPAPRPRAPAAPRQRPPTAQSMPALPAMPHPASLPATLPNIPTPGLRNPAGVSHSAHTHPPPPPYQMPPAVPSQLGNAPRPLAPSNLQNASHILYQAMVNQTMYRFTLPYGSRFPVALNTGNGDLFWVSPTASTVSGGAIMCNVTGTTKAGQVPGARPPRPATS